MSRHELEQDIGTRLALTQRENDPIAKARLLDGVIDELIADSNAVLDNYQDEICQFITDDHPDVRLIITKFIIHAIQVDLDSLTTLSTTINELLSDISSQVVRKSLIMLVHMCNLVAKHEKLDMPVKEALTDILAGVLARLSSDNDGIRTQALRTIESYCTLKDPQCEPMIQSARQSVKDFLKQPIISSGNIITGLYSLWRLAKFNPSRHLSFMIQQYESVHANLPPTLSATQVENVRKILKLQLLDILKTTPQTQPYHPQISQLLTDLGVKESEFNQAISSSGGSKSEKRKRKEKNHRATEMPPYPLGEKSGLTGPACRR